MTVMGRAAADRLKAALLAQRRGAADELAAIHELVLGYRIEVDDDLIDALLVSTVPGGGDGTPEIDDFVHLELCGLLGVTARHARSRIFVTLNLFYRHPTLWSAVQALELESGRATFAAARCSQLSREAADVVGRQWYHQQAGLSWKAAFDLLDRLIIEADPELAAKKDAQAAACREVVLWGRRDNGCIDVTARMDALDAMYLDATVDQLADILLADEAHAGTTKKALRAKALGIMATPALALAMQQAAVQRTALQQAELQESVVQPVLLADPEHRPDTEGAGVRRGIVDPDTGRIDRDPHHCLGHACGSITVPPAKLRPKAKVYLHIDATDLNGFGGAALIEKVGWVSSISLTRILGDVNVTIQPIIDLNTIEAEHQYRPSARMREAVQLVHPTEAFPYSQTSSRGCELDHTNAYQPSCRDAQTGIGSLAPLSHKVHHAKTVAAWKAQQRIPGEIVWTSPLGFQYLVTLERTYCLGTVARE